MRIVEEEIFGPVGAVIKFKTEEGTKRLTIPYNAQSILFCRGYRDGKQLCLRFGLWIAYPEC